MEKYWGLRLEHCKDALEENNFSAFIAETPSDAKKILIDRILPGIDVTSVSWGDSMTLYAIRHGKKTPCAKTSYCQDCKSPDRICNIWTIHEKSHPKGRIKVILINQDLGL